MRFDALTLIVLSAAAGLTPVGSTPSEAVQESVVVVGFDQTHAQWTEVLAEHVHGDRFDYAALKADRSGLDAYLAQLYSVSPTELRTWNPDQRHAFWINTYNAHVIDLVVRNYPLDGIKKLGSFFNPVWEKAFVPMNALHPKESNKPLSLDDIEHKILRPRFKDARVHAAVNCASIGCPPLRNEAYGAHLLDQQLEAQVRAWLADTERNRFDREERTIRVSEIFKWFKEDFERDSGTVENWIKRYAPEPAAEWMRGANKIKVKYVDYDWSLNDVEQSR